MVYIWCVLFGYFTQNTGYEVLVNMRIFTNISIDEIVNIIIKNKLKKKKQK